MTWLGQGALAGLLSLLLVSGCESRLPGPLECEALALQVTGVQRQSDLRDPRVRALVQKVTSDCLTTPYDRELVQCVDRLGRFEPCLIDLHRRRPELAPAR
ncbi:MAG TPA: hypothetical protein VLC09_10195 [Polyangiaceae bacterium]|nr:hypothetical protein [Polyangiaceae bacterium]